MVIDCLFLEDNQYQRMMTLPPMGYIVTFNLTLKYTLKTILCAFEVGLTTKEDKVTCSSSSILE